MVKPVRVERGMTMCQYASEHRCQGCGSVFYNNDIFNFNGIWYHQSCFESEVAHTFLCYEDGGEFAIQHHKDKGYWQVALKVYMRYDSLDRDIVNLYGFIPA